MRARLLVALAATCVAPLGCDDTGPTDVDGGPSHDAGQDAVDAAPDAAAYEICQVEAPTDCPEAGVPTYAHVQRLVNVNCVVCHYGATGGPWPMSNYEDLADWQDIIRDDLVACTMPPPDAGVQLSNANRLVILQWLRCGLPRP